MKQNDRTSCVYCGSKTNITADHIPPKCLFRERKGLQLITVPACDKCNNSYKKDDEYFRIYASADISRNEQGDKLWYEKVIGSTFRRSPKLRKNIASSISEDVRISKGAVLRRKKLNLDASRINNVLVRIVKGLYWHHYNKCLPLNILFEVYQNPPINGEIKSILLRTKFCTIGNEEFKYRYRRCDDDNFTSVWGISFFMGAHFLVFTKLAYTAMLKAGRALLLLNGYVSDDALSVKSQFILTRPLNGWVKKKEFAFAFTVEKR